MFSRFDVYKTNSLDNNEMIEAIISYVQKHPEKEEKIKNMLKSIDMSGSSKIILEELYILMLSYVGEENNEEELLIEIFKFLIKI